MKPRATLTSPRAFVVTNDVGFGRIVGDAMSEATARRAEDDDNILACKQRGATVRVERNEFSRELIRCSYL